MKIIPKYLKGGIPITYYTLNEAMPLLANNPNRTAVLDEVTVKPYRKIPQQYSNGITNQSANEKADEHVTKAIGNGEAFTPWGISGLAINRISEEATSKLPLSVQDLLATGRYISPSYWIDRGTGKTDEELRNGEGTLFGTGTGTILDIMSLKGIWKGSNMGSKKIGRPIFRKVLEFDDKIVESPKHRIAIDIITNPFATATAAVQGRYVYNFPSLLRNARRYLKNVTEGIDFTNSQYKLLTGLSFSRPKVKMQKWKNVPHGSSAYYSPFNRTINIPLYKNRYSNIAASNRSLKSTSAHEATHAAEHLILRSTGLPSLGIYSFDTGYFVPNTRHPIANKYNLSFMRKNFYHAKFPEEHWANYMGSRSLGYGKIGTTLYNLLKEDSFTPRGFLDDYKNYLLNITFK